MSELPQLRAAVRTLCVDGREVSQPGMPAAEAGRALAEAFAAFEAALGTYLQEAGSREEPGDDRARALAPVFSGPALQTCFLRQKG